MVLLCLERCQELAKFTGHKLLAAPDVIVSGGQGPTEGGQGLGSSLCVFLGESANGGTVFGWPGHRLKRFS